MPIASLTQVSLDQIFTLASVSSPGGELRSSVIISHVPRRWRASSLAMPQLWTTLHITQCSKVASLNEILSRSGDDELYLSFSFPPRVRPPANRIRETSHSRDIVTLLLSHSSRWRTLTIDANADRLRT